MDFSWERIFREEGHTTNRAKVFGGWLVNNCYYEFNENSEIIMASESMAFVSDPHHEWAVEDPILAMHACGDIYPIESKL